MLIYRFGCHANASQYLIDDLVRVEKRVFRITGIRHFTELSLVVCANKSCSNLFRAISIDNDHPFTGYVLHEIFRFDVYALLWFFA